MNAGSSCHISTLQETVYNHIPIRITYTNGYGNDSDRIIDHLFAFLMVETVIPTLLPIAR